MTDRQENQISLSIGVADFIKNNLAALQARASVFAGYSTQLNAKIIEVDKEAPKVDIVSEAGTHKKKCRVKMGDKTLITSNALISYFTQQEDKLMIKQARLSRRSISNGSAAKALYLAEQLLVLAQDNEANILPFGDTAAMLQEFSESIENFRNSIDGPKIAREAKKEAVKNLASLLKEMDAIVKSITRAMKIIMEHFPDEYNVYTGILNSHHNNGGTGQKQDVIKTLQPHAREVVFTISWLARLKLKGKNKGKKYVLWGLGTSKESYSGKYFTIGAEAKSVRQCKTFAPEGNLVIFENPNDFPVEIELTVLKMK